MRRTFAAALLAVLTAVLTVALWTVPAGAAVVLRVTVEDLTDRCHRAIVGTVLSEDVVFEREQGRIWTTWRVRADETWLGDAESEVVVSVPGGEADGITQDYEGGASLAKGDRAALFLWKGDDGRWLVLGEAQGAFVVRRDARTGDEVCANRLEGLALVDAAGQTIDADPIRLTLAALRTKVAAAREAREARERAAREARARKLEERRRRAERHAEQTRGKPGGAP